MPEKRWATNLCSTTFKVTVVAKLSAKLNPEGTPLLSWIRILDVQNLFIFFCMSGDWTVALQLVVSLISIPIQYLLIDGARRVYLKAILIIYFVSIMYYLNFRATLRNLIPGLNSPCLSVLLTGSSVLCCISSIYSLIPSLPSFH